MADKSPEAQLLTDDLMLAVFVAVESAHAFSAFMPSTFTTLTFGADKGSAKRLRMGFIPATIFTLVLGATVSYFAGSKKPLVAAVIVDVGMIGLYEWNIKMAGSSVTDIMPGTESPRTSIKSTNPAGEAVDGTVVSFGEENKEGSGTDSLFEFISNSSPLMGRSVGFGNQST